MYWWTNRFVVKIGFGFGGARFKIKACGDSQPVDAAGTLVDFTFRVWAVIYVFGL